MTETNNEIRITVHKDANAETTPSKKQLLGYIKFMKKQGSLEITNFNARLAVDNLNLGGTTKRDNPNSAGKHGEGFKIAALVMRRCNHVVQIECNSYIWRFRLHGRFPKTLYCRLSQKNPEMVEKMKRNFASREERGLLRALTANIWEDVTVKIWKGKGQYGKIIEEADFRSWLPVALDINGPSPELLIQTEAGDLILDSNFRGRVYLKGLRVAGHGVDGRMFVYGYNFAKGHINRDRERLARSSQEARDLASIWEQAVNQHGDSLMDKYTDLFRENERCADIAGAEENISRSLAEAMWDRLRRKAPNKFFYCIDEISREDPTDMVS